MACEVPTQTETASFEEAERHYRVGNYESALDGYQSFLRLFPESPLADVAELRIRTIRREVSSVMGRNDTPRPVYVGQDSVPLIDMGATAPVPEDVADTGSPPPDK